MGNRIDQRLTDYCISIIIPIFNAEKYLRDCLDSVITQSYSALEIILVDDGSTDGSATICQEYLQSDSRIKYYRTEHVGSAGARVNGLNQAENEMIMFVDADDILDKDLAETLIAYKDSDLVVSDIMKRSEAKEIKQRQRIPYGQYSSPREMLYLQRNMILYEDTCDFGILVCMYGKLFKKHLAKRIMPNLDLRIRYGEDRDFVYRYVLACNSVTIIDYAGYTYNRNLNSLSRCYDPDFFINLNLLRDSLYHAVSGHELENELRDKIDLQMRAAYRYGASHKLGYDRPIFITYFAPYLSREMKRIAIYGAGLVGRDYAEYVQALPDSELVLWVDSNKAGAVCGGYTIKKTSELNDDRFDVVLIAINDEHTRGEVSKELVNMGISKSKIYAEKPAKLI